ncbi:hypothetical protein C8R43DRAFT_1143531 [Mycena crocata]|nr:hypothetical protein C8R43DRAFT_1143531 [Mycena crocata]
MSLVISTSLSATIESQRHVRDHCLPQLVPSFSPAVFLAAPPCADPFAQNSSSPRAQPPQIKRTGATFVTDGPSQGDWLRDDSMERPNGSNGYPSSHSDETRSQSRPALNGLGTNGAHFSDDIAPDMDASSSSPIPYCFAKPMPYRGA